MADPGVPATPPNAAPPVPPLSVPEMQGQGGAPGAMSDGPPVEDNIPPQEGIQGSGKKSGINDIVFEDLFPPLDLSDDERRDIAAWFDRDLRSCVRNINRHKPKWATYRAVYMMEYVEKFYPDMGMGADYSSGLLLEKVLEGLDRLKRSILKARPLFVVDPKLSGTDSNIEFFHRAQWALHTIFSDADELDISEVLTDGVLFDFLLDGSAIVEVDTTFEKASHRTYKTYTSLEDLMLDENKALDSSRFDTALEDMQANDVARLLIEEDVVTKDGLQVFRVDKVDHLIPSRVYSDKNIKFRGRRMYLTTSDLKLFASKDVGWYDKDEVDKLLEGRTTKRVLWGVTGKGESNAREQVTLLDGNYDLSYQYRNEYDTLKADRARQPYEEVFAIYRVTCKYAYITKSDPEGVIPKYCVFDYSPEGRRILRSVTYPHFEEKPNWFHMKFGYAPLSYYGLGFGARLIQDDFLESNAVDLFLDAAALTTFAPMISKHPEAGGMFPFTAGYGPGKIGYVNDINDFKQLEPKPPNAALLRMLLPLTQNRASNRTNVTSLIQGRAETSDPRAPAAKAAMLLEEAQVGIDVMVSDWNDTGWSKLAAFVWKAMYEIVIFVMSKGDDPSTVFGGLIVRDGTVPVGSENRITVSELGRDISWKSQASAMNLNSQLKMDKFLQMFQFFVPLLERMAEFAPDMFKKYFLRWMRRAAEEVDLPGMSSLIPTQEEINEMPADKLMGSLQTLVENIRSGRGNKQGKKGTSLELGATAGRGGGQQ